MLNVESSNGILLEPAVPPSANNKNLPSISIFVTSDPTNLSSSLDNGQDASASVVVVNNNEPSLSSSFSTSATSILKYHSMLNIKQQHQNSSSGGGGSQPYRIKLNTENFSLLDAKLRSNGQSSVLPSGSYRKSLSRVNLSMHHLKIKPKTSTTTATNTTTLKSPGITESKRINQLLLDTSRGLSKSITNTLPSKCLLLNSSSLRHLNKSMTSVNQNNTNSNNNDNKNNISSKTSSCLSPSGGVYLSQSDYYENDYFSRCASRSNLFKSSNSLNALDLELFDSVSVGSFDRQSFNSCGANSEIDEPGSRFHRTVSPSLCHASTENGSSFKIDTSKSAEAAGRLSPSFLPPSSSARNKNSNKVIDWLNVI